MKISNAAYSNYAVVMQYLKLPNVSGTERLYTERVHVYFIKQNPDTFLLTKWQDSRGIF